LFQRHAIDDMLRDAISIEVEEGIRIDDTISAARSISDLFDFLKESLVVLPETGSRHQLPFCEAVFDQ
jgi:hypothetical protein